MTNINQPLFGAQPSLCEDFTNSDRQEILPLLVSERDKELKDPTSLIRAESQIRILCLLSDVYPKSLKTVEISDTVHLHRSTISAAANLLLEMELIEKAVVPGTENHVNPTLTFCIAEKYKLQVKSAVHRWLAADPKLLSSVNNIDDSDSTESESLSSSISALPMDKLSLLVTEMARQIKSLQARVSVLESKLDETSKQNEAFDLSEAFDALGLDLGGVR